MEQTHMDFLAYMQKTDKRMEEQEKFSRKVYERMDQKLVVINSSQVKERELAFRTFMQVSDMASHPSKLST